MKEVLHTFKKTPDLCPEQIKKNPRNVCFDSNREFFKKNNVNFMNDLFDDSNCMLYTNKYNFCSGYFPDFILSPTINNADFKDFYPKNNFNNSFSNGSPDFSYPSYYPHFKEGKYSKQISNANSKYNNSYFCKLQPVYKICKKFWEPFHDSDYNYKTFSKNNNRSSSKYLPGYERVVKSSERGTLGEYYNYNYKTFSKNNNRSSLKYLPGYERVVKSSERGTLGDHYNYTFYNKIKNNNNIYSNNNINGKNNIKGQGNNHRVL